MNTHTNPSYSNKPSATLAGAHQAIADDNHKAIKGMKRGRSLFVLGIAIAAGLSNGLSALSVIQEHTFGWYGGLIAFGIAITIIGVNLP